MLTRSERADAPLLLAALTIGAVIRLWIFAARPSLWIDEARLALNVGMRSYTGLLRPLDYDQAAPPLFLWAAKLSAAIGGMNEYALRALPVLASLCVPLLAFVVGDRLAGRRVGLIAMALCAISPGLVRHAVEFKPYELDTLFAIGLLCGYVVERGRDGHGIGPRTAVLGAIAAWASTPAVFVLATIALVELWETRGRRRSADTAPVIALWTVSFATAYGLVYRPASANSYLHEFWRPSMLTLWEQDWLARCWRATRDILAEGFVTGSLEEWASPPLAGSLNVGGALLLVLAAGGTVSLARSRGCKTAALLSGPWLMVIGASLVGAYPFAPRLTLFALPMLAIAIAGGVVALARAWRPVRIGLVASFGVLVGAGVVWCAARMAKPLREDHVRPAVEFFRRAVREGEPVYVLAGALPAWAFYTTDWSRPDSSRLARLAPEASSGGVAFENAQARGRAVDGDGANLVFENGGWVELWGVYSGTRWLSHGASGQTHPDTNWSWSEARRIRAAARPSVWVFTSYTPGLEPQLRAALLAAGGRPGDSFADRYVTMRRYYFDSVGAAPMR